MAKSKRQAQVQHAKRRLYERFKIEMSKADLGKYVDLIQQGKMAFAGRQSTRVTLWKHQVNGQDAWFVYDRKRKTVVTVLNCEPRWRSDDGRYGLGPYRPGAKIPTAAERRAMIAEAYGGQRPNGHRKSAGSAPPGQEPSDRDASSALPEPTAKRIRGGRPS